jgi:hypothetical protein
MSLFVFDAWRLDTTHGTPSQALSPLQGWDGNGVKYLDWLISQFKCNHCFGKDSEVLHAHCG